MMAMRVRTMKLPHNKNIEFLQKGGCFLYYYEDDPKCMLTNALIDSNSLDIFDDIREKAKFIKDDCLGDVHKCPYIPALWELNTDIFEEPEIEDIEEPEIEMDIISQENDDEIPLLNFGNISVDFDYSWPQETDLITDALIIPTNIILNFCSFVDFGSENNIILQKECKKRQLNFNVGDSLVTHGANTNYPKIAHAIIMDKNSLSPEIQDIGLALYNSLIKLDDVGCKSVSIYPLIKIEKEIMLPNIDLYLKTCIMTIMTFISEYDIRSLSYILIHIPPNFIVNLQDVVRDIDNIDQIY